jgi:hypothetical protein
VVLDLGEDTAGPGLLRERAFVFRNMDFEENSGQLGGALRVERGWAVASACAFTSNRGGFGSAIYVAAGGGLKLDDTTFESNRQASESAARPPSATWCAPASALRMPPCCLRPPCSPVPAPSEAAPGSAVYFERGACPDNIYRSRFSGNSGLNGGAMYVQGGIHAFGQAASSSACLPCIVNIGVHWP